MTLTTPEGITLNSGTDILWGSLNTEGLKSHLDELLAFMDTKGLSFLVLSETWLRPRQILSNPAIVWDVRVPRPNGPGGRGTGGIMVVRNTRLTTVQDFNCLEVDHTDQAYIWFRFRSIIVGGFYLSPHMPLEICMYKILTAENYIQRFGRSSQVFLAGDLNMRLGEQGGDTTVNARASLDAILRQMGLRRLRPINDQYTFESHAGRSTIDHVYGNERVLKSRTVAQVYTDGWIASSDHRLLACRAQEAGVAGQGTLCASHEWQGNVCLKVSRRNLRDSKCRKKALEAFKSLRSTAKQILQIELSPLYAPEGKLSTAQCQKALNVANEHVMDYIWTSLKSGGIAKAPHRPATSRLFWTKEVDAIAKERDRLWKQARYHPHGSIAAMALIQKAKQANERLQMTIKKSKRESFFKFSEALYHRSQNDTLKLLCNARRRHLGLRKVSSLSTEKEDLDKYAEHLETMYMSHLHRDVSGQYVEMDLTEYLTYNQLIKAMKSMPKGKAPGVDAVTAEILEVGGNHILSVMLPLYRAVLRSGMVPQIWNKAALNMIWKNKGSEQDISTYRPIALTVIFRKILEKILKPRIEETMQPLDVAQGGFRQGRSSLDLVFALDSILKEQNRKKQPCFQAFLDIKGAYDSVNREILWRKCELKNIGGPRLRLIKSMFDHAEVAVRVNGKESRYVKMGRGLLQGSLLSPLLFNVFIDDLPKILRSGNKGVNIAGTKINSLIYADDIVLISKTQTSLQKCLKACERHSRRNGYTFAPEKCEIIAPAYRVTSGVTPPITLANMELRHTDTFNYLGIPMTAKGINFKLMCQLRVDAAIKMSSYFKRIGCSGSGYPPTITRKVLHSFVRPLMEYGLGLQLLLKRERNRMDKAWTHILKVNQSLPRSTSSLAILKMFRSPAMSYRNAKLNAAYFARLQTMEVSSLAKKIFEHANAPIRRYSRLNVVKKSKNNHIWSCVQEWLLEKHSHKKVKTSSSWKALDLEHLRKISEDNSEMPRQSRRKIAQAIRVPGMRMEHFLTQPAYSERAKRTRRQLLLWRLGIIPGKAKMCLACTEGMIASRAHIARCAISGTKSQEDKGILSTNPLDDILNEDATIMGGSRIAMAEELVQYIIRKCLGRSSGLSPENFSREMT